MSGAGFRFDPPELELPAALGWLLAAAFGPLPGRPAGSLAGAPSKGISGGSIAELAAAFELGPRIVARHGRRRVAGWLAESAEPLRRAHGNAVAMELVADRLAQRLAARSAAAGAPLIFLKGQALRLLQPEPAGRRPSGDLDILAAEDHASALHAELVAEGWRRQPGEANEQHLPPLVAPEGMPLDLHFRLRGVKAGGTDWAVAGELLAAGLCRPAPGLPAPAAVPEPALLAAHLLSHGIEQHANRPATYPLLRLIADLCDLVGGSDWRRYLGATWPMIEAVVSTREAEAVFRLAGCLADGRLPVPGARHEADAELLLRHIVAGSLDRGYRESLRVRHTRSRLTSARSRGRLLHYVGRKLILTDDDIDAIYGPPRSRWGYVGRRLARPFALAAGLARSTVARLRTNREAARGCR